VASTDSDRPASAGSSNEPDFKLGDWWVRPQRNELERADEVAHVEARSMEVLVCLARYAPRVVGKQRLLYEVWSDAAFVGEEVISHAVWELRKALGDSAREPAYIKTVPRKGYVLLAEIIRPRGSPLPIEGARIDHYDIREELGRGSMGVVYKAFDRRLERTVAIKFLAPELTRDHDACRRFQREAQLAAALDHPNLATVHAVGETSEGQHYLVTPFYAGGSLKEVCARGTLSIDGAVDFARQLARGLAAAHAQGIVHRDVKPANLLIDEHGTLKIADFGIAKLLGATDLTRTGVSLGTPAYKSPEQAQGRDVDHRSDIWSFGVVLFEMLTGRRPFDGEYEQAVIHSILTVEPSAETDPKGTPIPEVLRRIVARAMAKEPGERYQTAEELARDLESLDGTADRVLRSAGEGRRFAGRLSFPALPKPGRAALAAAIVLVLLVASYGVWRARASEPEAPDEIRKKLAQASSVWVRGNDRKTLDDVRPRLAAIVRQAPDLPDALGLFAVFLADAFSRNADDRSEAERLARRALEIDPESSLGWSALARLSLSQHGALEAAKDEAERAIALEPSCEHGDNCDLAYVWLADSLWRLGRKREAVNAASAGVAQGNGHIRCRLKRAQLHELLGDRELAIRDYEEVLNADPTQSTALNELGRNYELIGKFEEAARLFEQLFNRTGDPRALLNQGNNLYELRRLPDAIEVYKKALAGYVADGISSAAPAVALGDAYTELREESRAAEEYQLALEIFERLLAGSTLTMDDRARRAVCLAKLGRIAEAESEIRALLTGEDVYPYLLECAARIAALADDRDLLFERARRAMAAGVPRLALLKDAAFIRFRDDPEYRAIVEPGPAPSR